MPLLSWAILGRILAARPAPDVLVVARGARLDLPVPRDLDELAACLAAGVGLVIRHGEVHDAGLARFAESFTRELPGEAHAQLFVTPGGTHGFGWHFDAEDVFIVQTAGAKDYYFRANTVCGADVPVDAAAFARFPEERSPLMAARLVAGDFLYVPSRWWHVATCVEDSLSISLGVYPAVG